MFEPKFYLLCLSSGQREGRGGVELAVDLAGEVALEAASDLFERLALGGASLDVGAGDGIHAHAG